MASDSEHALNPAHCRRRGTLIIRIDDSFLFGLGVGHGRIEYAAAATVLTTVLLFAFWIVSVLDNVLALTVETVISDSWRVS